MTLLLDGRRLAREREPDIARRAAAVLSHRGRPPSLLLIAVAEPDGAVPHVHAKLRACKRVGVRAVPLILPHDCSTAAAVAALHDALTRHEPDAVFLQLPLPDSVDGDVITAAIPGRADVDCMTDARYARFLTADDDLPPVTVTAALLILDEYHVHVTGLTGVVVAESSPFATMFSLALARRGARMRPCVDSDDPDLVQRLQGAGLIVVAAASPGLLSAADIPAGAVAIDVGYYNPGGRGDIDTTAGIDHLAAIVPVPGGIGPMTVSALVERVVQFAEGGPAGP